MKDQDTPQQTPEAAGLTETVVLDSPIKRGATEVSSLTLRKPKAGELRGIALLDLVQLDVGALQKVLPRISSPTLTTHEVANMDPADLLECGGKVVGFLSRKDMISGLQTA